MALKRLQSMLGKRITDVVVKSGRTAPTHQIFLVFEDGSAYEIYCSDSSMDGTDNHDGGLAAVLAYMPLHPVVERHSVGGGRRGRGKG